MPTNLPQQRRKLPSIDPERVVVFTTPATVIGENRRKIPGGDRYLQHLLQEDREFTLCWIRATGAVRSLYGGTSLLCTTCLDRLPLEAAKTAGAGPRR